MWSHLWPGGTWWSGFDAIWPNLAASLIVAPVAYFWKIRPHLRRLHNKLDRLGVSYDAGSCTEEGRPAQAPE